MADTQTAPQEISGLPPGAIVKPLASQPASQSQVQGLPPGAVVKPLQQPSQPAQGDDDESPFRTLHDLSVKAPEQEHEGLYKMKDEHGNLYGVPYSNVTQVENFRDSFVDEDEAKRYEKDARNDGPTWKDKLLKHTAPLTDADKQKVKDSLKGEAGEGDAGLVIAQKDFARGFANGAGTLTLHPWESLKGVLQQARDAGATVLAGHDNWDKHPDDKGGAANEVLREKDEFFQMLSDMKGQFKTNSPYAVGQMIGQGLVADAAAKPVMKALKATKNITGDAVRRPLQRVVGIGESSARKAAVEHATAAADAAKKHLDETQDALHNTRGKELEHQRAVRQAREDAANANREAERKHAEAVQQALHDTEGSEMQHEAAKRKADLDAAEANRKAAQEHLDATQKGLHETRGKELAGETARRQAEADAAEANHSAVREHLDTTQKALENDRRINSLSRRSMRLKDQIYPRLRVIQNAAKEYFNSQYDELSSLIGKRKASLSELGEYLESAKRQVQGSDPGIAIFNDIEKRLKGEIESGEPPENWHEMSPDEREEWRRAKSAEGGGITYEDLRGYDRELRKLASGSGTPADIKMAAGVLRDGLNEMQGELAKDAGTRALNLHNKLKNEYRDYAQTMLDKGSPVAKMMNARDADAALSVFEKMEPFERRSAQDLLEGQGEHANWLRRTDRAALGDERNIKTPAEKQAEELVATAGKAVEKAKANLENAAPGAEEGAQKSLDRAEEELERAKKRAANARPGFSRKQRNMNKYREHTAELVRKHVAVLRERGALERENAQVPDRPPVIEPKSVKPEARAEVPDRPEEIAPKPVAPPERAPIPDRPEEVESKPVAPPDRTAPPDRPTEDRPFDEEDLADANRKVYDAAIERLRKRGIYIAGAAVSAVTTGLIYALAKMNIGTAVEDLLGGGAAMVLSVSALNKLADLLDTPAARDFVSKPSERQIAALNKLPTDQKVELANGLKRIRMVAEKKGIKTSPLLTGFIIANAANATQSKDRVDAK